MSVRPKIHNVKSPISLDNQYKTAQKFINIEDYRYKNFSIKLLVQEIQQIDTFLVIYSERNTTTCELCTIQFQFFSLAFDDDASKDATHSLAGSVKHFLSRIVFSRSVNLQLSVVSL